MSKRHGRFLSLLDQVLQFKCKKKVLFTGKRNRSGFIHDLERVNEFLRLNSHVKFSSNKVEVTDPPCKILKGDRNCHLHIINKEKFSHAIWNK